MGELLNLFPVAGLAALVITIILYIVVMPRRKDGELGTFGQALHNFFHFKKLYLESLLKFIYVLGTISLICFGIYFVLIGIMKGVDQVLLSGLLMIFVFPVVVRLVYEILMMGILLVRNVIDINNKLPRQPRYTAPAAPAAPKAAPAQPAAPKAAAVAPVAPVAPKAAPAPVAPAAPKAEPAPKTEPAPAEENPAPAEEAPVPVAEPTPEAPAPEVPVEEAPAPVAPAAPKNAFCTICGSKTNEDGTCPNHCGK